MSIDQLAQFKRDLTTFAEEFPAEACVLANQWKKIMEEVEKEYKPKLIEYWQSNKELPMGYTLQEKRLGWKYHFEEDTVWAKIKNELEEREEKLRKATDAKLDWQCLVDETTGEIFPTVTCSFPWVSYSIIKKK